ncbi:hypothetical protein ABIE67_006945 [Streptomyces sp. V4I8]|uniref:hypothetical protein n=1 Tax=Streptomyces sp. V4I8 TaxID=3156469 RepID=UPI0035178807
MTTPPSAKPTTIPNGKAATIIPSGNAATIIPSAVAPAPVCAVRPGSTGAITLYPAASSAPSPSSRA